MKKNKKENGNYFADYNLDKEQKKRVEKAYRKFTKSKRMPGIVKSILKKEGERPIPSDITTNRKHFIDRQKIYRGKSNLTKPEFNYTITNDPVTLDLVTNGFIPIDQTRIDMNLAWDLGDTETFKNKSLELFLQLQDKRFYIYDEIHSLCSRNFMLAETVYEYSDPYFPESPNVQRAIFDAVKNILLNEAKCEACLEYAKKITQAIDKIKEDVLDKSFTLD